MRSCGLHGTRSTKDLRVAEQDKFRDAPVLPVLDSLNSPALWEAKDLGELARPAKRIDQGGIAVESWPVLSHAPITHHVYLNVNMLCNNTAFSRFSMRHDR